MNTNMLAVASSLSDHDLLDRLSALAGREREASAELVAHLVALDARPSLYAARGYGSLFNYCTEALRLSEDAACNRTVAVRACRRFPVILELLAAGEISLTSVRLLHQHLTPENHRDVLARAAGRSLRAIEALVAEIAPRPDVPTSVRKVPAPATGPLLGMDNPVIPTSGSPATTPGEATGAAQPAPSASCTPPVPPPRRPIIENTAPERYRVQFTIGKQSHDRLRRLQALLRREIPTGDAGAIVERALALLLEKVESAKVGATRNPRPSPAIRSGTDRSTPSRHVARHDKRTAWSRDGARCAFVAPDGRRCSEQAFLEFHHVRPHALGGPGTADNISLRCRRHNQFEAEVVFGPRDAVREDRFGER
jgi:hypothetical protein